MNYKFYQNKECEYFPCHKMDIEKFNCLFCYCPLYTLKEECNGNFKYLDNGIKSCMECNIPHIKDVGYDFVMKRMDRVIKKASK